MTTPAPDAPRSCGSCTLCCKLIDVPAVEKPMGQWCRHCKPGSGCTIHDTRPDQCRTYDCLWRAGTFLGPEWKPDRARFVLTVDPATQFLLIQVDPALPTAWRKEPYYSQIRKWAVTGLGNGRQVVVFNNRAATVILPDKDVPLGTIEPGDRIVISSAPLLGGGFTYNAEKRKAQP